MLGAYKLEQCNAWIVENTTEQAYSEEAICSSCTVQRDLTRAQYYYWVRGWPF